jgi:hypothetical protein
MIKFFLFCIFALSFIGCAHKDPLNSGAIPRDGISVHQAILIAEREKQQSDFREYFHSIKPVIRNDQHIRQFPEYWFVDYSPNVWMDFTSLLVVIDKRTGEVILARGNYWPSKIPEINWLLESTEFRNKNRRESN